MRNIEREEAKIKAHIAWLRKELDDLDTRGLSLGEMERKYAKRKPKVHRRAKGKPIEAPSLRPQKTAQPPDVVAV